MSGFSLGMRMTQKLAQSLHLSLEQRIKMQQFSFSLRMDLIKAIRNERYEPKATCPSCAREMTPVEIINGFNHDPNDFTTACSGCGHRFEARLICFGNGVTVELPFYCGLQALEKLRGKQNLSPEQLCRRLPGVYRSAIVHHGSIRRAFEELGIRYLFEEISDWKSKAGPFLGRMPDTIIADCVDASVKVIRAMRRKLGISRYTLSKTLEEAGVEV